MSQPAGKRATIREVAKVAGVSTMTVSRALNRSGYVAEAVRVKVFAAVEAVGYTPNQLARGLRSQRTGTIALLLTDVTNPFFTTVARGVEDAASDSDSLVLLGNTDESEAEELRYMRLLIEKRVDGVLLVPARAGQASLELATRHGMPVVVLDRRVPDEAIDVVRCDSIGGAAAMARHLIDLGHRRFAILAGPSGVSTSDDRVLGFTQAAREAGVTEEGLVLHGEYNQASGREMVREALSAHPLATAIFAANNFISIGALQELQARGVRVPQDMSLAGFDDLPPSMVTFPFLTVVSQPAYEMGHEGVHRLFERLTPTAAYEPREIVLPTEVIVRASTGRP